MKKLLITAISIMTLSACVSSGVKVDQSKLSQLHKGATTYNEAIKLLGKPSNINLDSEGHKTICYLYVSAQARPENFIPVVGAFIGGADSETTNTVLVFNENDILKSYTSNQGGMGMGLNLEANSQSRNEVKGN